MSHVLVDFQVHEIGGRSDAPDLQWARVTVRMKNERTGQIEEASAHVTLPKDGQMTLQALERLAQGAAAQLMKEAIGILQGPENPG